MLVRSPEYQWCDFIGIQLPFRGHPDALSSELYSPQQLAKVGRYIELGPKEGATLLRGDLETPPLAGDLAKGNFVRPTVFADITNRMRIASGLWR